MWSVMDGYVAVPDVAQRYRIIGRALFGDGAGAVVVGADPQAPVERPIFEMVSASQATLPGSDHAVAAELTKDGMEYRLEFGELWRRRSAATSSGAWSTRCRRRSALVVLAGTGITSSGWCTPGGPAIMDSFTEALGLEPGKLAASRRVLSE
jgi:predicted naringenin-chalcone synthase